MKVLDSGVQALDLHIAAECFYREFWDLEHRMLPVTPAMTAAGFKGNQDLPHCELMPAGTRICFMRANTVRPAAEGIGACVSGMIASQLPQGAPVVSDCGKQQAVVPYYSPPYSLLSCSGACRQMRCWMWACRIC